MSDRDNPNNEPESRLFPQLFETFLQHTASSRATIDHVATPLNFLPPSPPSSEPDISQGLNDVVLMEIADFVDQDLYTALADALGFPSLPTNWKRILYHAYNHLYSSVVASVPHVHRITLIAESITVAKQRCEQSNADWAAEENEWINIGPGRHEVLASLSRPVFRNKLCSTIGKAEWAFHQRALEAIIYLLISRPGFPALMPHLPGPPGTLFDKNQSSVAKWYFEWEPTYGCFAWHGFDEDKIEWFQGFKMRDLLNNALKNECSLGYLGLQEAIQDKQGIWTWCPLRARGAAALSIVSYVLAAVSVSVHADFLQQEGWGQYNPCPARRAAIEEEQAKIYCFLNDIMEMSSRYLSKVHNEHARDGLLELLSYLDFEV